MERALEEERERLGLMGTNHCGDERGVGVIAEPGGGRDQRAANENYGLVCREEPRGAL